MVKNKEWEIVIILIFFVFNLCSFIESIKEIKK